MYEIEYQEQALLDITRVAGIFLSCSFSNHFGTFFTKNSSSTAKKQKSTAEAMLSLL